MENAKLKNSLRLEAFSFKYPNAEDFALKDIELYIEQGDFVVLCGPSGCGKTTLLRQCKPAIAPKGEKSGNVYFDDELIENLSLQTTSSKIGFVQQNPENQIVTDKVWHELAFGLENLGCDVKTIRLRVAETASFFGIQDWFHKSVAELSGGQKQLLALASIMVMQPSLLILDEPTSQLDPIAASEFLSAVSKINRELGVTILITEHRLEEVLPLCTRAAVMDDGRILCQGNPCEIGDFLYNANHMMFSVMPSPMRVWANVENDFPCPVTVQEGRKWISNLEVKNLLPKEKELDNSKAPSIEFKDVWFKYNKNSPDVLKGLNLKAYPGEIMTVLGGNGTGKTTALSLITRQNKPYCGKIKINGENVDKISEGKLFNNLLGVLPQNPQTLFTANTVEENLFSVLSALNISNAEKQKHISEVTHLCKLTSLLNSHPYDLSGGEQQRAALAMILLTEPQILLLDEPTKGFDAEFKQTFSEILKGLTAAGKSVVMVSHDVEFCAECADRCVLFFDGQAVTEGTPRSFFSGNSFYTSSANRMARHMIPEAVTAEDIIFSLGGNVPDNPETKSEPLPDKTNDVCKKASTQNLHQIKSDRKKPSKLSVISSVLVIFLVIPLTIYAGVTLFDDRKYYLISMLIIFEAMLPFVLMFEGRKPKARELVILSVLIALAVVGRAAFYFVPQFKPVAALVIISGVAFGGQAGFLVGAMSAFVSNMIFGQGPWTPWQMFAFGIIGFLAGLLFNGGALKKNKILLCAFGGLSTFVIYGGLMNISSVLTYQDYPTIQMFVSTFVGALPFDIIHSLSTVIFLFIIANPMLKKLERVKIKYSLV